MAKLSVNVAVSSMETFASIMQTISQAEQDIQKQATTDTENYDKEIVSLTMQESALETKFILTEKIEEISKNTLWQIGRSGRSDFQGQGTETFDYHVGMDKDAINSPDLPHIITVQGKPKSKGTTEKLNIHFTLDRNYLKGELAFIYDRWGAEKDQVLVDNKFLTPISGAGIGKLKHVVIGLSDISSGNHVITITTSGNTSAGKHRIDYLKLTTIKNTA